MTNRRKRRDQRARLATQIDRPEPGFFRIRRKGVWRPAIVEAVPARDPETMMTMDRVPHLRCVVDGEESELNQVWHSLHRIGEREYEQLTAERASVVDAPLRQSKVRF